MLKEAGGVVETELIKSAKVFNFTINILFVWKCVYIQKPEVNVSKPQISPCFCPLRSGIIATPGFCFHARDLNSGLHDCMSNVLLLGHLHSPSDKCNI